VGFAEHGNRDIVQRAAALCPDSARVMVDSNESWSLEQAKTALHAIEDLAPYFAEEALRADAPLADWEALAKSTDIPLAGGENIYGIDDFLTMTRAGLRVLQPDVAKWGGVSGALDLASAVPDHVLIWPHFMGTAVGQLAALSVSAALGDASCCEVDVNDNALRTTLCGDAINITAGRVGLPAVPGLVIPPMPDCLDAFANGDT
ncbi:MAG: enolase C-terminal domain-like protein, partial [Pseudomonadota bacterium]